MANLTDYSRTPTSEKKWIGHRVQPHTVFLVLATTFGLAVLAANPPYQAPDENDHFYRAYQLSEGGIVGRKEGGNAGGILPAVVFYETEMANMPAHPEIKMTRALFRKKWERPFLNLSAERRIFVGFPHTVYYPPFGYLPQAFAMFLGRLVHIAPLGLMYLARLAVLAVSVALGYAALRRMPIFRWSCLLLLLAPMSLYLMGSVAPDALLVGNAFLLAALLVKNGTGDALAPDVGNQAGILILASLLATAKIVYLPLVLLAPLFLMPRLSGLRQKAIFGLAFAVLCIVPLWAWSRMAAGLYVPGRSDIPIDPVAQWHFVAAHPLTFLSVVGNSIWVEAGGIYRWFVGTLGWGETALPEWFYLVFGIGVVACVIVESSEARVMRGWQRTFILGAAASTSLLIVGAQYAIWNSPGSLGPIESLQGRYFLPVAPFVALGFPPMWRLKVPVFCAPLIGGALATLGAVVCLRAVVLRFYFP